MTHRTPCRERRGEAFARLRGELSPLAQRRFDDHRVRCPDCRAHFEEVRLLMETGRASRALPTTERRDDLWARIEAELPAAPRPSLLRRLTEALRPHLVPVLATSAAAALALVWLWPAPLEATAGARGRGLADSGAAEVASTEMPRWAPPPLERAFAGPLAFHRPHPRLDVGVGPECQWSFTEHEDHLELRVDRGVLAGHLVHADDGPDLRVVAPGARVRVVGTVFVVHVAGEDASEVGVVEGRVTVASGPDDAEAVPMDAGSVRRADGTLEEMDGDLAPVRSWLDAVPERPEEPEPEVAEVPRTTSRPEPDPVRPALHPQAPDPEASYVAAEEALAAGRPAEAARRLERIVRDAPGTPLADTARLDLARLYARRLGRPERAVRHLEAWLASAEEGPRVTAARALLCSLDADARACDGGVAQPR